MRRRRRSKVQLAFGGVVTLLFVFYAWDYHDLIKNVVRETTSIAGRISGMFNCCTKETVAIG